MTRQSFDEPAADAEETQAADATAAVSSSREASAGVSREATAEEVRAYSARVRAVVETALDEIVPSENTDPSAIHAAIRWSLFAPAKRFRPLLVFAAGETFGAAPERLVRTACAFELIHTYSLVHDD